MLQKAGSFTVKDTVVIERSETLTTVKDFDRIKPIVYHAEKVDITYEPVPQRTIPIEDKINQIRPKTIPYSGNKG